GNGNDVVFIAGTTFARDFGLLTGAGADTVNIATQAEATITQVEIEERTRTVTVIENGVHVVKTVRYFVLVSRQVVSVKSGDPVTLGGTMPANLGGGDDALALASDGAVTFNGFARLDGQGGHNSANVNTANLVGSPTLKHFDH